MPRKTSSSRTLKKNKTLKTSTPFLKGGMMAYCVKCKQKRTMKNTKKATSSNGRNMMKGNCVKCNTPMNVFTK